MSDKHNDGGPAFPVVGTVGPIGRIEATGISIRDYFAGQALAGWGEDFNGFAFIKDEFALMPPTIESIAATCYALADAMLKERSK